MTLAIGYEPNCGVIVIQGNGVFPARSLTASLSTTLPNTIAIKDLGGRGEQTVVWGDLTSLDGSYTPASMADALAYLNAEFSKCAPAGDAYAVPVTIGAFGQTTIPLDQPPSRFSTFRVEVNGVVYRAPDISVTDVAVTWLDPEFSLEPSDRVTLVYS